MKKTALVQVRMNQETKESADRLFDRLGLDTPTAVRIFIARAIQVGGLPFNVIETPGRDTADAIRRAMQGSGLSEPFDAASEMLTQIMDGPDA
jgi:DNA-damage-inducible protein J